MAGYRSSVTKIGCKWVGSSLAYAFVVIALLAGAILLAPVGAQTGAPAADIYFGHIGQLAGPNARPDFAAGIQLAFTEANSGSKIPYFVTLHLLSQNEAPDVSEQIRGMTASPNFVALLASVGDRSSDRINAVARTRNIPLVGAVTGKEELRAPFDRRVLNLRMSYNDEINRLMTYVLQRRLFWRIACLYEDTEFGRRAKDHLAKLLEESGRSMWGDGRFDPASANINVESIFDSGEPQAVVIFTTEHQAAARAMAAVEEFPQQSIFAAGDPYVYLFISSFNIDGFTSVAKPTKGDIIITSFIPPPLSDFPVANRFRGVATTNGVPHTFDAMEGYLIGRVCVEAMALTNDGTPEKFNNNLIERGLITIDNIRLGPFTDSCAARQIGLCDCNQGARDFYMLNIHSSGAVRLLVDEPVVSLPMSRCNHTNWIPLPLVFVQLHPYDSLTGFDDHAGLFALGIASKFEEANEELAGINGRKLILHRYQYNNTSDDAPNNAVDVATRLRASLPVVSFLGNVGTEHLDLGLPQIATYQPEVEVTPTRFRRNVLKLDSSIQMEMLAIVDYIHSKQLGRMHFVHSGTVRGAQAASMFARTAHHYQIDHTPVSVCSPLVNIFFGIEEPNIIIWEDCYYQFVPFLNTTTVPRIFIFSRVLYRNFYKISLSGMPALYSRVFFPHIGRFDRFNARSQGLIADMMEAMISYSLKYRLGSTREEISELGGPFTYMGYLAGTALQTILYRHPRNLTTTPEDFLRTWYGTSVMVIDSVKIGPYSDFACNGSRTTGDCECNEGASRVSVATVGTILEGTSPHGPHLFALTSGCRIHLNPLFEGSNTLQTVLSSVAGVVTFALVIGAVVFLFVRRTAIRDNAAAPKDESKPFCVLFTDIQSSTSLWAGVPTIMAKALEAHHAEIRKLVRKHKCYEVKTIGDAFMIVCENPAPGVALALDIQRVFYKYAWGTTEIDEMYKEMAMRAWDEAQPDEREHLPPLLTGDEYEALWSGLRVRVGVHYGMGEIKYDTTTKGYDYYGTVVNTAARVESVCHGGQVGMTGVAYDVIKISGVRVDMLGECMLRGLSEPITLYQVLPEELGERRFPPLRLDVATTRAVEEDGDEGDISSRSSDNASSHSRTMTHQQLVVLLKRDPMVMDNVFTADQAVMFHNISVELLGSLLGVMDDAASRKLLKEWCTLLSVPYHNPRKESVSQLLRHGITMRMLPSAMRKVARRPAHFGSMGALSNPLGRLNSREFNSREVSLVLNDVESTVSEGREEKTGVL